jgi:hypothetical protein
MRRPFCAPSDVEIAITSGIASPKACGQKMMSLGDLPSERRRNPRFPFDSLARARKYSTLLGTRLFKSWPELRQTRGFQGVDL